MLLKNDIELIDGLPVAYLRSIKSLVISDLHLGYESAMAKNGVFIPKANLKSILEILGKAASGRDVETLVIVGDIKNEFSKVDPDELNELNSLLSFVKSKRIVPILVMGNHDNYIESYSKQLEIKVHHNEAVIGGYLFVHGDKRLTETALKENPKMLIIGHEHPTIGISTKIGNIERLRCFVHGEYKAKGFKSELLVLPAIGYFETGSDINFHAASHTLSPILKEAGIDRMDAIAVGFGSTLNFGKVGELRKLLKS